MPSDSPDRSFPDGFLFGVKSSAYQVEGSVTADGRGVSVWDTYSHQPGATHNGDTGDVTADHYRHLEEDLDLLALRIISDAGQLDRGQIRLNVIDGLDQPLASPDLDEIPLFDGHSATTFSRPSF